MKRLAGNMMAFLGVVPAVAFEIQEAPTLEEMTAKRNGTAAHGYADAAVKRPEEVVEIKPQVASLLGSSQFIVGAFGYALVPAGSVVATGSVVKVVSSPPEEGKMISWQDFILKHRAGLRLLPVTAAQLEGEELSPALKNAIAGSRKAGMTCVTTFNGNPVRLGQAQPNSKSQQK